jgi:4-amino-4-deoxy-L-arabinose transferase-like glycosyltransferase
MRLLRSYLPILLLLYCFGVLVFGSRALSLTSDEPAHITVGYALLARGRTAFWLLAQHGHPPLLNILEALLVYLEKPAIPLEHLDGWPLWMTNYVRAFVPYLMPMERTEVVSRMPIILLTVSLGALIFRWGKELGNYFTGLIALVVFCFDPNLLAHGRLATTDVGTVTLGTASLYLVWRWLESPSWGKAAGIGGLLGLTMLAKGNGVLWTGTVGLIILWKTITEKPEKRIARFGQGLFAGFLSFLILWAGYAFTWGPIREEIPGTYPAPDHWNGLISQALSVEKRWVFAIGMQKHGNWWWYFPLAFLIKNPLPLLLVLGIVGIYLLRRPVPRTFWVDLGLFSLLYAVVAVKGGMNIGYRHMLPVHPLIYLTVGEGIRRFCAAGRFWRWLVAAVLGLWYVVGTVRMFPYEIAYFNELIGGPQNGHRYLVDSNIDWGQGYKALRHYLDQHPGPIPKIAYHFTYILPSYYGIPFEALPPEITATPLTAPFHPLPGRYVLSITSLQHGWFESPSYAWFRQVQPTAEIGYSFFLYDISPPPLQWIAQCNVPAAPLSEQVIARGFGRNDLRQVEFDCRAGWVYPSGSTRPGVYALHNDLIQDRKRKFPSLLLSPPVPRDQFVIRRLSEARLSLDMNRYTTDYPAFVLYEQEKPPAVPDSPMVVAGRAEIIPNPDEVRVATPVALSGPLAFLGAGVYRDGGGLDVETWWQVIGGPIARPFSIMGHLLTPGGAVLGVSDGLAVSPVELLPGDILVQRHRFDGVTGEEFLLRTGAYWLDTMERWSVAGEPGADAIFIQIRANPLPSEAR